MIDPKCFPDISALPEEYFSKPRFFPEESYHFSEGEKDEMVSEVIDKSF